MLLLLFSPPPPPTTISHINFQYYSVFFYGKKQLLLLGQALFSAMFGSSSQQHWRFGPGLAGFNLDRKTSIKVGDLGWSELQINFTDRGRNIWYNEEINWSFKLLSFNHSEGAEKEVVGAKFSCALELVMMWKKCFIDGCCLADKYRDSGQKYKVEEI